MPIVILIFLGLVALGFFAFIANMGGVIGEILLAIIKHVLPPLIILVIIVFVFMAIFG